MISTEKPGTPEELVHFGVRGMKWGIRSNRVADVVVSRGLGISTTGNRERSAARASVKTSSGSSKAPMSKKKKVAIGVGVGIAVVGGATIAGYILGSRGKVRISDIDGGKDNLIRLKNGKAAISTLSNKNWDAKIREQQKYARNLNMYSGMAKREGMDFVRKNPASGLTRQEHLQMIDALNRMKGMRVYK